MTDIDRAIQQAPKVLPPEMALIVKDILQEERDPTLAAEVLSLGESRAVQEDGGTCDGCDAKCSDCPEPSWQVTVEIPARLPFEVRDSLFAAVADAVSEWEPDDRDGWDAFVSGHPTRRVDPVPTQDPDRWKRYHGTNDPTMAAATDIAYRAITQSDSEGYNDRSIAAEIVCRLVDADLLPVDPVPEATREEVGHAIYEATDMLRDDDMLAAADALLARFSIFPRHNPGESK